MPAPVKVVVGKYSFRFVKAAVFGVEMP